MNGKPTMPWQALNDALLKEFAVSWRARGLAEQTGKEYVRNLRAFEKSYNDSFLNVTRHDLNAYIGTVLEELSAATAAYKVRAFKSFYSWLAEEGEIEQDPAVKLRAPTVPEPVTKIASAEDIAKMLAPLREGKMFASFYQLRDAALIHVLRTTGLRISEAARIELDHVMLGQASILIPKTKTRKPRTVALDPLALRRLSAYLRRLDQTDTGCIWRQPSGEHLKLDGVKQAFERRARAVSVDVTPHQLRRALAADWMRRGGSQTGLQTMAGWASPRMVSRYVSAQAGELALEEHRRLFAS